MYFTVELLLFVSFWVSAHSNIPVVFGNVGEEVILPCTIEYEEELSSGLLLVRWKTKDLYVHFYDGKLQENLQEERQHKRFKGRTQLFVSEFPKGNLSLLLSGIQMCDAGIYECLALLSKVAYTKKAELVVQDKQYGFTSKSSVVEVSVLCLIICVGIGLYVFLRRRKKSRGRTGMAPQDATPDKQKTN